MSQYILTSVWFKVVQILLKYHPKRLDSPIRMTSKIVGID